MIFSEKLKKQEKTYIIWIEKIKKNPEFSIKIGVRNTSGFISRKQSRK